MTVEEFKKFLAVGHIYKSLYHFTDSTNLPSIAKHGILSKQQATEKGIAIAVHGGNECFQAVFSSIAMADVLNDRREAERPD